MFIYIAVVIAMYKVRGGCCKLLLGLKDSIDEQNFEASKPYLYSAYWFASMLN